MPQTASEQFVGQLNANVFFAEFAFESSQLRVPGVGEVELADHLVILDNLGLIFQIKERSAKADDDAPSVAAWFAKKVRKAAVGQVADTKAMMRQFAVLESRTSEGTRSHCRQLRRRGYPQW